jgi:predicted ATPase/DNA-binding SARP family transcriptional activator
MIEFRLLGSVDALRDGQPLPIGGRQQRALLALFLVEPGVPLPVDRLIDELWSNDPPAAAGLTLRSYVSRLRAILGDDAPIRGAVGGYAIDVDPEHIDARRFERLLRQGQASLAAQNPREAVDHLRAALALWRGDALARMADDGRLKAEADRLHGLRLLAIEDRIEAELALGHAADLVDELETIVREEPYRERPWRQLMLALYRSGRQADALATYHRARSLLVEELGIEPSEELRLLEGDILRQEVPIVRAPSERHNLPAAMTSFVGRAAELETVDKLLREARLVTLTGVGGVGKTRLAVEVASRGATRWADGAWFVDLSGLRDPALVERQVANGLDIEEQGDVSVSERLVNRVRNAELLLVIDNCEHLREACAELVHRLLTAAPRLSVMATSREALGVPGEIDMAVPPLGVPPSGHSLVDAARADAVRLFLARAHEARPDLVEDPGALAAAATICRDLDGLPLAIELAAARAKALTLDEIADRIGDRFRFLVSWRRLTPGRHRTLREAMDWSYELLEHAERSLLARLSVFAGGFTLDASAEVCLDGNDDLALELVDRVVRASLIVAEVRSGRMRYRLLDTVRQYAAERLAEAGEMEAVHHRHADWCLALAERIEPELTGDGQTEAFATLEAEHDNFRAALGFVGLVDVPERRLRLTVALTRFWYVRGYLAESRRWLELALAEAGDASPLLRRRAFTAAAAVALIQGDYAAATAESERSLAAARETGEARLIANGLSNLGAIVLAAGNQTRAAELLGEAVELARRSGDTRVAALAINNLGDLRLADGDYARAGPLFEESLALLRARGDTANVARSLFNLGAVALMLDRLDEARVHFRESLELGRAAGDKEDLAWCLLGFAGLAASRGDGYKASLLLGSAVALLGEMGAAFKPFERHLHDSTADKARDLSGEEAFQAARRDGGAMSLDAVIGHALADEVGPRTTAA